MDLTHMKCLLHIDQSLNVDILLLTLTSSSAFNVAIYVAVFTTPSEWSNLNVSSLFHQHANGLSETLF